MKLYNNIRKKIVGKDFSSGFVSGLVRKKAFKRLSENYNRGDRILSLGCGEGLFIVKIAGELRDVNITGVDNSKKILKLTGQKIILNEAHNIVLKHDDAEELSLENNMFEHVFFINALHNQIDVKIVKNILKEMIRVCAPGGYIYFDFRNSRNFIVKPFYRLSNMIDSSRPVLKMYSKNRIKNMLNEYSLSEINFYSLGFKTDYLVEVKK
ncbi:MAG: class I SAM-dependent methyltransferase [Elusimicrobia bacterium]|jgi:ubiquinone/menaquinone biosynthesis C-methylase UbiE|nr:class I SAM-dependent methyltransferase [Elusimicrobiota bacterium]